MTNLGLVGDGIQLLHNTISPAHPPDIFSGDSMVITGRFRGNPTGCVAFSGTGMDGRPWASRVNGVAVGGRALTQLSGQGVPRRPAAEVSALPDRGGGGAGAVDRIDVAAIRGAVPVDSVGCGEQRADACAFSAARGHPIGRVAGRLGRTRTQACSPYATRYSRILASSRGSAGGRSTPRLDVRTGSGPIAPAPPTYSAAPPMPQSAPQYPQSAGPGPSSAPPPPGSWSAPPAGPGPVPPRPGPSRRGRYVGVGAAVAAVALGGTLLDRSGYSVRTRQPQRRPARLNRRRVRRRRPSIPARAQSSASPLHRRDPAARSAHRFPASPAASRCE